MEHRFSINNILQGLVSYKGLPYPGLVLRKEGDRLRDSYTGSDYELSSAVNPQQQYLKNGTPLYSQDAIGRWYFMPVYFSTRYKTIEFPYAVISVKGSKKIVSTELVGAKGEVNELISTAGYSISLAGMILSQDGSYPEDQITELKELITHNESVELVCALTDLLLDPEDKVIITSYDYPSTPGVENGQAIKLELKTDSPFELIIE